MVIRDDAGRGSAAAVSRLGYRPELDGIRGIALVRILIDLPARFPAIDQERRTTICHGG